MNSSEQVNRVCAHYTQKLQEKFGVFTPLSLAHRQALEGFLTSYQKYKVHNENNNPLWATPVTIKYDLVRQLFEVVPAELNSI